MENLTLLNKTRFMKSNLLSKHTTETFSVALALLGLVAMAASSMGYFTLDNFASYLGEMVFWTMVIGVPLREVFILKRDLAKDNTIFWRFTCWTKFGLLTAFCAFWILLRFEVL